MLKSRNVYKRANSKKIALKTLIFVTLLSIIGAITTIGVGVSKEKVTCPNIVNSYAQTQEYQETLNEDYKEILSLAEEKGVKETTESLQKLDTIEYRTEKLLNSENEAYIEQYNKNDNLSKTLGSIGAGLLGVAAVSGVAGSMLNDSLSDSKENQ